MSAVPAALLGNGSLLATLSGRGRIERLWWPHPDRAQHLGELRVGIEVDGRTRWLDEEPFAWEQSYVEDASMLRTVARDGKLEVELLDLVHPEEPVLLRRVSCSAPGTRPVVRCRPQRREGAALAHEIRSDDVLVCAFGTSPEEATRRTRLVGSFDQVAEERVRHDSALLADAPADPLYRRSLLVFDLLTDRETGGVIAAPELDPAFVHSGGYGFVWARDLAFLVLAFLAANRAGPAKRALTWLPPAQEQSGLWLQRHWTDGSLAPSWCVHQLDETGSALFAYEAAWRELRDESLDAELWPSARRAADFLLGSIDERGLPSETADLWEEREGRHAYTAASIVGGLRAAASFARRHRPELAERYAAGAERARSAIERAFWSEEHGRYLRSIGDATVDVSLLGLAWPFRAVDPRSERMRRTAAAVVDVLQRPEGGVLRYDGDRYAGGNRWVLAALWLGLWHRQVGDDDGHGRALRYAQRVATPLGLLAEQVDAEGRPVWVLPLAWSHAMFLLATRPELELVRAADAHVESPVRVAP